MEKQKRNDGITLIALVITIIVLLILAGISIGAITGDNGIINQAQNAKNDTEYSQWEEQIDFAIIDAENKHKKPTMDDVIEELINKDIISDETKVDKATGAITTNEPSYIIEDKLNDYIEDIIPTTTSYVGYYADIEGDGTVDGIIFADLSVGNSGRWEARYGYSYEYSYNPVTSGLKSYKISQTDYSGVFGENDVLTATTSSGTDRFYVMALEDINPETRYTWYDAAHGNMGDFATVTSIDFGTGKSNTITMIEKWNNEEYGAQDDNDTYKDMWGVIQDKVKEGWFVPSYFEWITFGGELGITQSNYSTYKLGNAYLSSSISSLTGYVSGIDFINGRSGSYSLRDGYWVRLTTTF